MHRVAVLSTLTIALIGHVATQAFEHDDIAPNCRAICTNIANVADECEREYEDVPNEDQQELDCICSAQSMDTLIPSCEACQRQYYGQDDDYDEIQTLLQRCGFSSMTETPSGTMTQMWASAESTVYTTTWTSVETDDDDNNETDIERETVTSYILGGAAAATTTGGGAAGETAGASTASDTDTSATDLAGSASDAISSATDSAGSAISSASDAASSAVDSATGAAGTAANSASQAVNGAEAQDSGAGAGNAAPMITAAPVLAMAGVAAAVFGL